jgi:hypothetical protein
MSKKIGLEPEIEVKAAEQPQAIKYTKAALVGSKRFQRVRDLLNVILADGAEYTIDEAEKAITNYLKKEV